MSIDSPNNFKVDFIGVGAPKCGTTWISACLSEHPEINFSKHKETDYFLTPDSAVAKKFYEPTKPHSFESYRREFVEAQGKILGEYSVYYLYDLRALERIKKVFPNVKIIISLRNPLSFLNSAYWFYKSSRYSHLVPDTVEKAVAEADPSDLYCLERVKFSKYVKHCFDIFGKENVFILLMEDIKHNSLGILKEIFSFLGVDPDYVPKIVETTVHGTRFTNSAFLTKFTYYFFEMLKKSKILFYIYDRINKNDSLYKLYTRVFKKDFHYPDLSSEYREELLSKLLPDIESLEKLIERDLSAWKN